MGIFRGRKDHLAQPSAFVAEICDRLGEQYGGFDTVNPRPSGSSGPGVEVAIHVDGERDPDRPPFLQGTGVVRTARAYPDRTEVFDGDTLLAVYDDLTVADVFAAR